MRTAVNRVPSWFESRPRSQLFPAKFERRNQFTAGDSNGSETCPTNKFYRVRLPGPLPDKNSKGL